MAMRRDRYTGEWYDDEKWYRGANGLWHNVEAERRFAEECARRDRERFERRNASRRAKGRRPLSWRKFQRRMDRFEQFRKEDGGLTFGEWLQTGRWKRW